MSKSRYDADHDGVCDHASCRRVVMFDTNFGPDPALAAVLAKGFTRSASASTSGSCGGIDSKLVPDPRASAAHLHDDVGRRVPKPISLFGSAFDVAGIGSFPTTNYSLIGASDEQLAGWGYAVPSLPSVEPKIDECRAGSGLRSNSVGPNWTSS